MSRPRLENELDASFVAATGRRGVAVQFRCPCCLGTDRATRILVPFRNPLDGGAPDPSLNARGVLWEREGDTLETLTLHPSVDFSHAGHWHGFVVNGSCV
jgi:hypothetical protein